MQTRHTCQPAEVLPADKRKKTRSAACLRVIHSKRKKCSQPQLMYTRAIQADGWISHTRLLLLGFVFYWITALSVHLDHCRAMGCRTGDNNGPGRSGRRLGEAALTVRGSLPVHKATGTHPSSQRRPPTFGVGSGAATYPADEVHQARITQGVGEWETARRTDRKEIGDIGQAADLHHRQMTMQPI